MFAALWLLIVSPPIADAYHREGYSPTIDKDDGFPHVPYYSIVPLERNIVNGAIFDKFQPLVAIPNSCLPAPYVDLTGAVAIGFGDYPIDRFDLGWWPIACTNGAEQMYARIGMHTTGHFGIMFAFYFPWFKNTVEKQTYPAWKHYVMWFHNFYDPAPYAVTTHDENDKLEVHYYWSADDFTNRPWISWDGSKFEIEAPVNPDWNYRNFTVIDWDPLSNEVKRSLNDHDIRPQDALGPDRQAPSRPDGQVPFSDTHLAKKLADAYAPPQGH